YTLVCYLSSTTFFSVPVFVVLCFFFFFFFQAEDGIRDLTVTGVQTCALPILLKRDLLSYVEAIVRVYNQFGRRDNIYKARIKILVHELGAEAFAKEVDAEWQIGRASCRERG